MNGKRAEKLAALYLWLHGYRILDTNFHSRFGEIDIIVKRFKTIVFCEVKARGKNAVADPGFAVDEIKQRKILKTAQLYTYLNKLEDFDLRFDVIKIKTNGLHSKIEHIKDAFGG